MWVNICSSILLQQLQTCINNSNSSQGSTHIRAIFITQLLTGFSFHIVNIAHIFHRDQTYQDSQEGKTCNEMKIKNVSKV